MREPLSNLVSAALPARLDEPAREALRQIAAQGESQNTVASYRSALRYWHRWHELRFGHPMSAPVASAAVIQFILDHAAREGRDGLVWELPGDADAQLVRDGAKAAPGAFSYATIAHRISVLSKFHAAGGHAPNPCADPAVRELLRKTRRIYAKRGDRGRGKPALTRDLMERILATCDDSLAGRRDRALLLFAWASGGRRRSEVTAATLGNVTRNEDGTYTYRMGASKANQAGDARPQDVKPIAGRAAQALADWLSVARIRDGAVFRAIRKGTTPAEPLTPAAVRVIVQARCAAAGLPAGFSAHSLRSGFLTEAGRQNIPLGDAIALSGHASVAVAMRYYRAGSVFTEKAARLMG